MLNKILNTGWQEIFNSFFEYSSWENFLNVMEKAKVACSGSNMLIQSHFRDVMKMVNLGSGTKREIPDR